MATYRVTLKDGQSFLMSGDMVQAAAPIKANFHDPDQDSDWQSTPYQTADARHSAYQAAELVAKYFSTGDDDCTEVSTVHCTGD